MMSDSWKRTIVRWVHVLLVIPVAGYIYGPFEALPSYAPSIRYFFFPAIVLVGLWMWKGYLVQRLFTKGTK
jgi:hypothetical protein